MNNDLEKAREEIRRADAEIIKNFEIRMKAAGAVAAYKKEYGLPIEDKEQEKKVTGRIASLTENEELRSYSASLAECLMTLSKKYQSRLNEGFRVAYNGEKGAFAYIAAKKVFPEGNPVSYGSFEEAYRSVENSESDIAILPIENSYSGEVGKVIDLMYSGSLYVSGVYSLPVTQNLLGVPGTTIESISSVVSHPQALKQCDNFIQSHCWNTAAAESTAQAAKLISAKNDIHLASIGSAECAEQFGLEIIRHDISESHENTTKFAVFTKNQVPVSGDGGKFILIFTVDDKAGALVKALNVIGRYGFNMQALRSRPVREKAWQYYFYTEIEGDETSDEGKKMLEELASQCDTIKIAGHYSESGVIYDN